jgi:C_GCAxxG_C_C family probable redox protein
MARRAELCGAVAGALMVIGLAHGRTKADDEAAKELTYDLSDEFIAEFAARKGSTICRELLGVDISTPEGLAEAKARNVDSEICVHLVRDTVDILGGIIE